MRTVTGSETTLLQGAHFATFARVLVEDADGTYQDLTNQDSIDWVHSGRIAQTIDQIVATGSFTFWRKQEGGNSLAPLDEDSTLNRDAMAAYAPLIDVGRGIRCEFATVAIGSSPSGGDWQRVFQGVIDQWTVEDDFVQVMARDAIGAEIADRWIEAERTLGTGPGRAMQDVIQDILTEWTGLTLFTPTSPSFLITTYIQQRSTVMDALQQLAALTGWVVQPRWDDGTSSVRLTLYDPDRAPTSTTWTWEPDRYEAVPDFTLSRLDIRNALSLWYTNTSDVRAQVTASDATSITKYGRQWMEIEEPKDSPIDTSTEAQNMLDKALLDLKDPVATQEIKTLCFWPVQLNDYYLFGANDVHYTEDRSFGVTGFRHEFGGGQVDTFIRTRGVPAGFVKPWIQRAVTDPQDGDIGQALTDAAQGPFVRADPDQSGSTGSLDITIEDPELKITAIEQQQKSDSGGYGGTWLTGWDRSTGTIGVSTTLTRGEDISLVGKHNASIKVRVTFTDSQSVSRQWQFVHTFDADDIAEITGLGIGFDDAGLIIINWKGDEDWTTGYVKALGGGVPSDPTAASNDGDLVGQAGSLILDGTGSTRRVTASIGEDVFVKVLTEDPGGKVVGPFKRRRGDAEFVPPRFEAELDRDAQGNASLRLTVTDPSEAILAPGPQYSKRGGSQAGDTWSTLSAVWDTEPSQPPYSGLWVEALVVPGGEEAGIRWQYTWKDEVGINRTHGITHYTAMIDEHLTELILPLDAGIPLGGQTWGFSTGGALEPGTANKFLNFNVPLPIPEGVLIEEFEARLFRDATHDTCTCKLIRGDINGAPTTPLATLTGATGGWSTQANVSLNETVTNPNSYHAHLSMRGIDAGQDARAAWVKIKYCRFNQQQAY